MGNPVHKEKDGWYFWDETEATRCGPYKTKEDAEEQLEIYSRTFLTPMDPKFKHCATCRFWIKEETLDEGICNNNLMNSKLFAPPVGGVATYAHLHTHAIFGCVNHNAE